MLSFYHVTHVTLQSSSPSAPRSYDTRAAFVYSLVTGSSKTPPVARRRGRGRGERRGRVKFSSLTSLPPRPYAAASSTSLLHEPTSRTSLPESVGPPLAVCRECVSVAETHYLCSGAHRGALFAAGSWKRPPDLRFPSPQVYPEPKNDGECLHNIKEFLKGCTSFRVEVSALFFFFFLPSFLPPHHLYTFLDSCSAAYTTPRQAFRHPGVPFYFGEYRRRGTQTNKQ